MSLLRRLLLLLVVPALLLAGGCGAPKVKPNGKVVRGGQPFTLSENGVFIINFTPEENDPAKPQMYNADAKPDGTFTIVGPEGKGIPPGKYKANVQAMDPYAKQNDLLKGKFAPGKSPLVVEIKDASEVVLDVGK